MARIYVTFSEMKEMAENCAAIRSQLEQIKDNCQSAVRELDWDVRCEPEIANAASRLAGRLEEEARALRGFQEFLQQACTAYENTERDFLKKEMAESLSADPADSPTAAQPGKEPEEQLYGWLKSFLALLDKSGVNPQAGVIKDGLSYFQALFQFFSGDQQGLTGAKDWCDLADKSAGLWKGFYDYLKKFNAGTGIFSKANQAKAAGVGLAGDFMGLVASIFGAADTISNTEGIGAAGITGEVFDVGSESLDLIPGFYQVMNPGTSSGLFSPVSSYTAIGKAILDTIGQGFKSYETYYADGSWDANDTASTMVDSSMAGLYSIGNFMSFGLLENTGVEAEDMSNAAKEMAGGLGVNGGKYILEHPDLRQQYEEAGTVEKAFITFYAVFKSL